MIHELPEGADTALLIGHNPGLEDLVLLLVPDSDEQPLRDDVERKFPTASTAQLCFDVESWRDVAAGVVARGKVMADVVQACVVTDDPIPVSVEEPVALRFVAGDHPESDEVELSEDALDTMSFDGAAIDLGEAAADTMALALDPFPRGPNAATALKEAGVISEEDAKPLSALAGLADLRAKLEKR